VTDVHRWLAAHGAQDLPHAGGSLYDHLLRVHAWITDLGLGPTLALAGLTHAAYGTDGFATALTSHDDRGTLRALIGADAEAIVYRYGACDRDRTWPHLAETAQVTDRFTGRTGTLGPADLRDFADLTILNELDVAAHDPGIAAEHGAYFRRLFTSWAPIASPQVSAQVR
jgi:hypothetical protein